MHTYYLPPNRTGAKPLQNKSQAKLDFYSEQTDELLETSKELRLVHEVVRHYSQDDAAYYLQMYVWLNLRYDYVMDYAMTYIPSAYEKH